MARSALVPVVAVSPWFTTKACVSLWLPCQENPVDADPCLSLLWAGAGPRRERRAEYSGCCPGGGSPSGVPPGRWERVPFRRNTSLRDRPPLRLCSQGHEALGLD